MKRRSTHNVAIAAFTFYVLIILITLFVYGLFREFIDPELALCGAFGVVSAAMWARVYGAASRKDRSNGTSKIQTR